mmetsp:Transcript_18290/g.52810  ORF Transcript_18290/g.52810 Transcript_18290/m.52810 type:complete len:254 (-) Transcript_18290:90-851(-)
MHVEGAVRDINVGPFGSHVRDGSEEGGAGAPNVVLRGRGLVIVGRDRGGIILPRIHAPHSDGELHLRFVRPYSAAILDSEQRLDAPGDQPSRKSRARSDSSDPPHRHLRLIAVVPRGAQQFSPSILLSPRILRTRRRRQCGAAADSVPARQSVPEFDHEFVRIVPGAGLVQEREGRSVPAHGVPLGIGQGIDPGGEEFEGEIGRIELRISDEVRVARHGRGRGEGGEMMEGRGRIVRRADERERGEGQGQGQE